MSMKDRQKLADVASRDREKVPCALNERLQQVYQRVSELQSAANHTPHGGLAEPRISGPGAAPPSSGVRIQFSTISPTWKLPSIRTHRLCSRVGPNLELATASSRWLLAGKVLPVKSSSIFRRLGIPRLFELWKDLNQHCTKRLDP
jgi:hypothetical protein